MNGNERDHGVAHEQGITLFIQRSRRERYEQQLRTPKNRHKFLERLPHFKDWDESVVVALPGGEQSARAIVKKLEELGAGGECWIVSPTKRWDARALPLGDAINTVVGMNDGSVVSCVPGVLAYYEGEELGMRLISIAKVTGECDDDR